MAKKAKKRDTVRTWAKKTKTPKNRRAGNHAAAHHTLPVVHLQTPISDKPSEFHGMTEIRRAFLSMEVPPGRQSPLVRRLLRRLQGYAGTYLTRGYRILRDGPPRTRRGK